MFWLRKVCLFLGLAVMTASVQAGVITHAGDSFTEILLLEDGQTDLNGNTNNTGQDISIEVTFSLADVDTVANTIDLAITATNTTAANDDEVGLYRLGFGIDPNAASIAFFNDNTDEFVQATLSAFPAFPDSALIDITAQTRPGARRTLQSGETDMMLLRLGFDDLVAGTDIVIMPINVFIQSDPDSFQFGGLPPIPVAAPTSIPLLLIGLLVSALGMRRSAAARTS